MRITYLLAGTELFGGTKVVLRQANLLAVQGHEVTILAKGPKPDWQSVEVNFRQVDSFEDLCLSPSEVCVATYWTTIEPAAGSGAVAVHFCQGFEGSYTHNVPDHPAIEQAYALPLPAMTVAPHLTRFLQERFGRPAWTVAQPLEPLFEPRQPRRHPNRPARVLITGPFEIDWKGVATGVRAVARLRELGIACELIRLSQWPATEAEQRMLRADEFHAHMAPAEVAELLRGCDLLIAPSWEQEGFGLPVLEAMASGLPVVASDISSFRWFAHSAASLVPAGDVAAFAAGAREILANPRLWQLHRRRGLAAARKFTEQRASREAMEAIRRAVQVVERY